jgi:plastocyanin
MPRTGLRAGLLSFPHSRLRSRQPPNHTVTADQNNLFDVRVSASGGIEPFTAPTTPGTYPFHSKYHANMHGTL